MQIPREPIAPACQVAEAIALALLGRPGFAGLDEAKVVELPTIGASIDFKYLGDPYWITVAPIT